MGQSKPHYRCRIKVSQWHARPRQEGFIFTIEADRFLHRMVRFVVGITVDVARELLRLAPDDVERLDDARMLHASVVRMKDYSQVGEDVELMLRAMRRQLLKPEHDEAAIKLLINEFELLTRDLAKLS